MDLSIHIKQLLYKHNCLVLPGFGGLLLHYHAARIHPAQHQFLPPRKAITFNKSLTVNDGLLTSCLANTSNIHYNTAELLVDHYVQEISRSLKTKGDFTINGVGKFRTDIEGHIIFESNEETNYLTDAFGMEHFVSPAIIRRDSFQPQQAEPLTKKTKRFNWFGLSGVLLIMALLTYQILDITKLLKPHDSASILPDSQRLQQIAIERNEAMQKNNADSSYQPKRDTMVQIIVIRDETSTAPNTSTTNNSNNSDSASTSQASLLKGNANNKKLQDSIRYSSKVPYPLASEYNPSKWGNFLIVFSRHKNQEAAILSQKQLINERIGVRIYVNGSEYFVVKSGYLTKQAAAKDIALYGMLGYSNTWIYKMSE